MGYSNNEICSNIWEIRKLKTDAFDEFLCCSIRKKQSSLEGESEPADVYEALENKSEVEAASVGRYI
jgi:hypothetical protein